MRAVLKLAAALAVIFAISPCFAQTASGGVHAQGSPTKYDMAAFSSPAVITPVVPASTAGIPLVSAGSGSYPVFGQLNLSLTGAVTGILPAANIAAALVDQTSINGTSVPASAGTLPGSTGTFTLSDCLEVGSTSPLEVKDAGAACGSGSSGTVNSGTLGQTAYYAGAGTAVSGTSALILGASSVTAGDPVGLAGYATASLPTCNSTLKGSLAYTTDGTPALSFCNGSAWTSPGGTTFTIAGTGCTPTAATGSATAGTFTLATGPCTSVTVTFNGAVGMTAPNGWHCDVGDRTLQAAGTWWGNWGESATTTTTATIPIPSAAGTSDVISFACTEY